MVIEEDPQTRNFAIDQDFLYYSKQIINLRLSLLTFYRNLPDKAYKKMVLLKFDAYCHLSTVSYMVLPGFIRFQEII